MSVEEFCSRLDGFFGQLPKDLRYAVEIRNAGLLGADYHKVLETLGVAHVYNQWSYMPSLDEQHKRMETSTGTESWMALSRRVVWWDPIRLAGDGMPMEGSLGSFPGVPPNNLCRSAFREKSSL